MRIFSVLLLLSALPAAAEAQPLSISASVAVTWLDRTGSSSGLPVDGAPASLGMVSPPTLVVLWRGQPGWAFMGDGPPEGISFEGSSGIGPSGEPFHSVAVMHGKVRLELEYWPRTRTARVNRRPIPLPEGHDVVLLDHVDEEPEVVRTLSVDGEGPEPIEVFLGRSPEVRQFMRCDVPLPEGVFAELGADLAGRFRDYMQELLDGRCELMGS